MRKFRRASDTCQQQWNASANVMHGCCARKVPAFAIERAFAADRPLQILYGRILAARTSVSLSLPERRGARRFQAEA